MTASVVIRALDEEASIGRTLELLEAQSLAPAEVIVVDSGSTDETVRIARSHGARIIEIDRESFSFGGALNTGCEAASGEIVVALSAHAFPTDPGWLERIVASFEDPTVCCASGTSHGPDGEGMEGPIRQDEALARRVPTWGYSNAAGAFKRNLWERHRFRADMPATEDKEWALHWLAEGWVCLIDPALAVEHSHGKDPLRDQFERARREAVGYAMVFPERSARPALATVREWWSDQGTYRSPARARLSHRRIARLVGDHLGRGSAGR